MLGFAVSAYGTYRASSAAFDTMTGVVNGSKCFVAGTLVLTEDGEKPIEEIEVGDYVYASDPETGENGYKEVLQTFVNESSELVHIYVNSDEIVSTPTHPFYSPQRGWTSAVDLKAGDILVLSNGEYVIVEQVQHEILESPVKVYNFEVQDFHTYYVGKNSVLVHNYCHRMTGTVLSKDGEIKRSSQQYESGGGNGRPDQQEALLRHTERKFLNDLEGFDFSEGDTIIMNGSLKPCKPGCQPAIRDFVTSKNVNVLYYAANDELTYSWTPFSDSTLKGTVLQQVFDSKTGELLESWRYWRSSSGRSYRALYNPS